MAIASFSWRTHNYLNEKLNFLFPILFSVKRKIGRHFLFNVNILQCPRNNNTNLYNKYYTIRSYESFIKKTSCFYVLNIDYLSNYNDDLLYTYIIFKYLIIYT